MAHLETDVAAFVDGQLSPEATDAATRHLQDCERCREAVLQQRQLKRRMQASGAVRPPASLLASLSSLPDTPEPPKPSLWSRVAHSHRWGAAGVLAVSSLAIVLVAYAAGGAARGIGDAVVPPVEAYAAQFAADRTEAVPAGPSTEVMSVAAMDDLTANGWPCHGRLGADLDRVEGRLQDEGSVSLTYTDGVHRLELHEENGALDHDGLTGFRPWTVGDRTVSLREQDGTRIVTWDADGVVYTVVTDAGDDRLLPALADLPSPERDRGITDRVGDGLARMAAWISV